MAGTMSDWRAIRNDQDLRLAQQLLEKQGEINRLTAEVDRLRVITSHIPSQEVTRALLDAVKEFRVAIVGPPVPDEEIQTWPICTPEGDFAGGVWCADLDCPLQAENSEIGDFREGTFTLANSTKQSAGILRPAVSVRQTMTWKPEKEPEPAKVVDMTQLHLLDHWPFSARRRAQNGGGRNHLKLAWWFKWRDRTRAPWRRLFWCPFGSHDESLWVAGDRAWVDCSLVLHLDQDPERG